MRERKIEEVWWVVHACECEGIDGKRKDWILTTQRARTILFLYSFFVSSSLLFGFGLGISLLCGRVNMLYADYVRNV